MALSELQTYYQRSVVEDGRAPGTPNLSPSPRPRGQVLRNSLSSTYFKIVVGWSRLEQRLEGAHSFSSRGCALLPVSVGSTEAALGLF
ncbi:hypothetical protein Y1Q_0009735 [Alligator mississippiensis]|uniref:Uncharacterized protein n=1 Tax=Alligator mississippiensis TaxID=8496 RepID=A0A151MWG5_ALLMI|nr:hypothetical protein Y1Q_0009735 [Alligator mississippiensis]